MAVDRDKVETAIAALDAQRAALGDAVVDRAIGPLRELLTPGVGALERADNSALRHVTVMFVDVVGSTAIGSVLEPEDIHELIDPMLRRFTSIITNRRGRVMNYTGDGLLAAFGADVDGSHEDNPEQAVHAGIEILEAMRQSDGPSSDDRLLRVRVGLDSGQVLIGGGIEREQNIRGTTVNMAARMEQHAPVDGLRISAATYRLVRGRFDVVEQPPIVVKGVEEPQVTYLVERARPRAFRVTSRGIDGLETPMIGRSGELAALCRAFARVERDASYQSVVVVGDAGIGKSRLLVEFEHWLDVQPGSPVMFRARAQQHTRSQPFGLLRDLVAEQLGIADNDTAETARLRLLGAVVPLLTTDGLSATDAVAETHLLGHVIGFDWSSSPHVRGILSDAQQIRSRAFRAVARLLRSLARGAPVVVLIEDLHWVDDGSLDLLEFLSEEIGTEAVLVVASTRPELFDRRPSVATGDRVRRIDLTALGDAQRGELADALLGRLAAVPTDLRELVVGHGDGNPYFMEELIGMLLDEGAIAVDSGGSWRVARDRLSRSRVPPGLTGVLQSRFDGLALDERTALQAASVIGFVAWDTALDALLPGSSGTLARLVQRGFLVPQRTSVVADASEFTFRHHLMHQFVRDTLLKRERRAFHALAAAWYAPIGAERGAEYLGLTGEHYEQAGDTDHAVEYFAQAAEQAAGRGAHESAIDFVSRALLMVDTGDHRTRWRLLVVRERVLSLGDDRARHQPDLDALEEAAEALDDDACRATAAWRRCSALYEAGEHSAAERAGRLSLALAQQADDRRLEARTLASLASTLRRLDRRDEARAHAARGLAVARDSGDGTAEMGLLETLSAILAEEYHVVEAERLARQACTLARELGDRMGEALALNRIGGTRFAQADFEGACRLQAESVEVARRVGYSYGQCIASLNLSGNLLLVGDAEQSLTVGRAALDLAILGGTRDLEAAAHTQMGLSLAAVGQFAEAIEAHSRAHDLFVRNECLQYTLDPLSGMAAAHLALGDLDAAVARVDQILRYLDHVGNLHGADDPPGVLWRCYRVLERADDPRASNVLSMAYDWVMNTAARFDDGADRDRYVNAEPSQRGIVETWQGLTNESGAFRKSH